MSTWKKDGGNDKTTQNNYFCSVVPFAQRSISINHFYDDADQAAHSTWGSQTYKSPIASYPHLIHLLTKIVWFRRTSWKGECVIFGRVRCAWGSLPLSMETLGVGVMACLSQSWGMWTSCLFLLSFSHQFPGSAFQIQVSVWSSWFSIHNFNFMLFLFLLLQEKWAWARMSCPWPPWPATPVSGQRRKLGMSCDPGLICITYHSL